MTFTCATCAKTVEAKTDRVPRGWTRHQDKLWCPACWGKAYVIRAVTISSRKLN